MADWISSAIGAVGNMFDTGLSIAASAKAAKRQYEYQRALNQQAYDLTQQGYRESYGNMRLGLENAGYNPILAVNSNPYTGYSGGSATGMQPNINSDISGRSVNAFRAFKLDKELNKKQQELLEAEKNEAVARTKNLDKDTELKPFDKPLKVIGDILSDPDVPSNVKTTVTGVIAPTFSNAKNFASSKLWNFYDFINDTASHIKWNARNFGGAYLDRKYFDGLSKSNRIRRGVYKIRQLKYDPHIN